VTGGNALAHNVVALKNTNKVCIMHDLYRFESYNMHPSPSPSPLPTMIYSMHCSTYEHIYIYITRVHSCNDGKCALQTVLQYLAQAVERWDVEVVAAPISAPPRLQPSSQAIPRQRMERRQHLWMDRWAASTKEP
jgi:hypothetical protein